MASNAKKKLDEKHLKMLRDMAALMHNRECFDCHQRGPTYVNMTVGSFICTACSGLLRGLNPPHRVKSISMATFSAEEMDFLTCRGNEFCRRTWTGLHDGRSHAELSSKDESKMRDFLAQKYEKKRWYVAPTEAMLEEAQKMNTVTEDPKQQVKSLNTGIGALSLQNGQNKGIPKPVTAIDNNIARPSGHSQPTTVIKPPSEPQIANMLSSSPPKSQPPAVHKSASADLFADFGGDPFGSGTPVSSGASSSATGMGFGADFSQFNSASPATNLFQPQPPSLAFSAAGLLQPQTKAPVSTNVVPVQAASAAPLQAPADKYSALADLDGLFGSSGATPASGPGASAFSSNSSSTSTMYGVPGSSVFGGSSAASQPSLGNGSGGPFGSPTNASHQQASWAAGSSGGPFGGPTSAGYQQASWAAGSSGGSSIFGSSAGAMPGSQSSWGSGGASGNAFGGPSAGQMPSWGAGGSSSSMFGGPAGSGLQQPSWGGGGQPVSAPGGQGANAAGGGGWPSAPAAQHTIAPGPYAQQPSGNPFLSGAGGGGAMPGQFGGGSAQGWGPAVPTGYMPAPPSYANVQTWPAGAGGQPPAASSATFPSSWGIPAASQQVKPIGGQNVTSTNPFL